MKEQRPVKKTGRRLVLLPGARLHATVKRGLRKESCETATTLEKWALHARRISQSPATGQHALVDPPGWTNHTEALHLEVDVHERGDMDHEDPRRLRCRRLGEGVK